MLGKSGSSSKLPTESTSLKVTEEADENALSMNALKHILAGVGGMAGHKMEQPDTKDLFKQILLQKLAKDAEKEEREKKSWRDGTVLVISGDEEEEV